MHIHHVGLGGREFTFSEVNGRHHFSFSNVGSQVDLTWCDDLILPSQNNRYALLVFNDGNVVLANSNKIAASTAVEAIGCDIFLIEFDKHFRQQHQLLEQLPNCARCVKGLLFKDDGHGNYDITDGDGAPLFNINNGRLLISKVTMERIRSKLPAGVAVNVSKLFKQLSNLVEGVTATE